jgi:fatty acid desaturase
MSAAVKLSPEASKLLHEMDHGKNGQRFAAFLIIYVAAAVISLFLADLTTQWRWAVIPLLWLTAGAALHGISLFTHEAVHGTLAVDKKWNALFGALCAWPVWQNYSAYRVLHLRHHDDLGGDHDPDHYANYTRWTWGVFILNWLRLIIGYPVYLVAIPLLGFKHGSGRARIGIVVEVMAVITLSLLAVMLLPWSWLLHGWLGPMIFINVMVNIRGMSQHTLLEEATDEIRGTRSILTHPLVQFFMCHENYHLEHHLHPGVPWYRLPEVHRMLAPALRERGAPFISSYSAFVLEFMRFSFRRGPWRQKSA